MVWSNVPLLVTEQIVNFTWPLKCKCCSYDLKPDYIMANVLLSFAFCVHPEQKRDTYFAFTKAFSICWSKCSLPNTFDWSQREISVICRQISGSVTFSVLVFHGYVNQNDFSHAVRGPGEKMIVHWGHSQRSTAFWLCVAVELGNQSQVMRTPLSSHQFWFWMLTCWFV